jgi:chemotaxis protein MotA
MSRASESRFDLTSIIGLPAAAAIFVAAQLLEGGSVRSLWQPTAALVVFGGTLAATFVSFPWDVVVGAGAAVWQVFVGTTQPLEPIMSRIVEYAQKSRRKGVIALENEIDRTVDPFLRAALTLVVDGANPKVVRQILEIESHAMREAAEAPAEVLETAAGYSPTLGILGAVLGLIHVMEHLSEPSKLGAGIAVAFVATVYGVASANMVLLPLATKLRGRAHHSALCREIIIEGVVALQEGLNPRLIQQKLWGYLASVPGPSLRRQVA